MSVSLKPVREQVMVITGASSGIGLATAQAAAREGAKVVLAARNGDALAQIERDLTAKGGAAAHVAADVSRRADVKRIADVAVARFGRIDTWVNNAGTSIFGKLDVVSDEDHRRLFDINFWGLVYGSLEAVTHLRDRGGALINVGSVLSDMAVPIQGMYSATKHAVKGFTDALRLEVEGDGLPISVTLIKPSAINTPFTGNAKNYTDREPRVPDPVYTPEEVAAAILQAAARPERDVIVGTGGRVMSAVNRQAPRLMDYFSALLMPGQQKRSEPPRNPAGTLDTPGRGGEVSGDHTGPVMPVSVYNRADRHPVLTGLLVLGAAGAALALLNNRR